LQTEQSNAAYYARAYLGGASGGIRGEGTGQREVLKYTVGLVVFSILSSYSALSLWLFSLVQPSRNPI